MKKHIVILVFIIFLLTVFVFYPRRLVSADTSDLGLSVTEFNGISIVQNKGGVDFTDTEKEALLKVLNSHRMHVSVRPAVDGEERMQLLVAFREGSNIRDVQLYIIGDRCYIKRQNGFFYWKAYNDESFITDIKNALSLDQPVY